MRTQKETREVSAKRKTVMAPRTDETEFFRMTFGEDFSRSRLRLPRRNEKKKKKKDLTRFLLGTSVTQSDSECCDARISQATVLTTQKGSETQNERIQPRM